MNATEEELARYAELQTIAFDSARNGAAETLRPMIEAGMPVELQDEKGNSFLMLAAYHGHAEVVRMLLDLGADPDQRNGRGQTPLGGVAFKGDLEIARILIEHGAVVDADQGGGQTPLLIAKVFGRDDMVELLQKAGADNAKLGLMASIFRKAVRTFRRR